MTAITATPSLNASSGNATSGAAAVSGAVDSTR